MNIYVICTGNTCRSPMAEAIFHSENQGDWEIRSAGIHATDGFDIAENAKICIEEANMPYTSTSKSVRAGDIEWADYIFTMTDNHKQSLIYLYPEAKSKIFTLKEFSGEGWNMDIQDPFGGQLDLYKQTFNELQEVIGKVSQKLTGG